MVALATDKLLKVGNPGSATTLSAPGYTIGATSITVGSTSNWPTDTGVVFAIDEAQVVNGVEVQVAGTYNEYVGVVSSGTSVTSVAWKVGVGDRNYSAGALTRVYIPVSAERENRIVEWGTAQHNQDGTHGAVTATSVAASGTVQGSTVVATGDSQLRSTSLETIRAETEFDYVASGGVWSGDAYASTLNASMTAVTAYINGRRGTVAAVTARAFTASKDTYVDVLNNSGTFSLVYTEVANDSASPALAANSIRLAIIVTGASNIANVGSVNQGQTDKVLPIASSTPYAVTDSLGNLICPRDPNRRLLGYRQIISNYTGTIAADVTGLSVPVIVPTGRKIVIKSHNYGMSSTTAGCILGHKIVEGATQLAASSPNEPAANYVIQGNPEYMTAPTAGLHTYKVTAGASAGSFTLTAGSNAPAFIRVELA